MRNLTNFKYVDGTAAHALDFKREEPMIVSYRRAKHAKSFSDGPQNDRIYADHRFFSAEDCRNLMGAKRTFTKMQFVGGTLFCFGGGLLMILLERMF